MKSIINRCEIIRYEIKWKLQKIDNDSPGKRCEINSIRQEINSIRYEINRE